MRWGSRKFALKFPMIAAAISFMVASSCPLSAQQVLQAAPDRDDSARRMNDGVINIIHGGFDRANVDTVLDMASVINAQGKLRIVPIIGQGDWQNIMDVLYLKGVDIAVVQSDVLAYFKHQNQQRDIGQRVVYIAQLYNQEFHLLARE